MKILHVVHAYPPSLGGSQWLMRQLSRGLVERHHDEVTVFTTVARNTGHFIRDDGQALPETTETVDSPAEQAPLLQAPPPRPTAIRPPAPVRRTPPAPLLKFDPAERPPDGLLGRWMEESYWLQAPKKLVASPDAG